MKVTKYIGPLLKIIQKIIPVKKSRVLFTSFNGHYSDSPKCISQKIYELAPQLEQVWLVKKQYINNLPEYVRAIDIDRIFTAFWYRATAHIIVDNVYGEKAISLNKNKGSKLTFWIKSFLNKKRGQFVFTTWHGTPLKRMGRDQIGQNIVDFSCPQTTMLLGNQFTLDIMKHITFGKIKMELLGTPRNDILFLSTDKELEIKKKLGVPEDKKIILFAPTFRSDAEAGMANTNVYRSGINQLEEIDFSLLFETLSKVFGGEWVMVCRFHYHVEAKLDWNKLQQKYSGRIINGNEFDDMSDYLACADVLLTDASSSMFDFAIRKKPCFLFFPDIDYYKNSERGFYMQINELPFEIAENFLDLIKNITEFNEKEYIAKVQALLEKIESVDDLNSSERVAKYILKRGGYKRTL